MDDDGIDRRDRTLRIVELCDGPVVGVSSRRRADGSVACAGHRIRPADAAPEYMLLQVPLGSQHCPLAWNLEAMGM